MNWMLLLVAGLVGLGFLALKRMSFVPADQARQLLRQRALVVDVRSPGEFKSGHLPGALNIPLGRLSDDLVRCVPDRQRILLLHCLSGARSGMAKRQAKNLGYLNVFNLGSYGRAEKILRAG